MVDLTLIQPINRGQGHSFWYQSISHIRLPVGSQFSNFCSRTHRLATIHKVTTSDDDDGHDIAAQARSLVQSAKNCAISYW